jgi:hypothetical protein
MTSRRTSIGGQFAPHTIAMLRSPAWRALSLSARRVLDRIEIELADHGGTDNGKLPVTYDDFVRYGIDRCAIAPAIREVVALGFVEITELGRAGNAEWRKPNLFRLTFRNTKYAPTNEWEKITEEQAKLIARAARIAPPQKTKSQWGKISNPSKGNQKVARNGAWEGSKTERGECYSATDIAPGAEEKGAQTGKLGFAIPKSVSLVSAQSQGVAELARLQLEQLNKRK